VQQAELAEQAEQAEQSAGNSIPPFSVALLDILMLIISREVDWSTPIDNS
jgi:hypothetical protein